MVGKFEMAEGFEVKRKEANGARRDLRRMVSFLRSSFFPGEFFILNKPERTQTGDRKGEWSLRASDKAMEDYKRFGIEPVVVPFPGKTSEKPGKPSK